MKEKIFKALIKHLDLKGLAVELVCEVADDLLEKAVNSSSTPFDNIAKASLWPVIEEEAKKLIEEHVDAEKWLGLKDEPKA